MKERNGAFTKWQEKKNNFLIMKGAQRYEGTAAKI